MSSVNLPPNKSNRLASQRPKARTISTLVLNIKKLAIRTSKYSPLKTKRDRKSNLSAGVKAGTARAGPGNAMNRPRVIDLTSDDEDDNLASKPLVPAYGGDLYDADDSDNEVEPEIPLYRRQANQQHMNGHGIIPQRVQKQPAVFEPPAFEAPAPVPNPQANTPGLGNQNVFGDYILDDDLDDEGVARAFAQAPANHASALPAAPQPQQTPPQPAPIPDIETRDDCIAKVLSVFPDICTDYVSSLFDKVAQTSATLLAHLLDKMEKESPYPKAKDKQKNLKRKREVDEDEAAALKYGAPDRVAPVSVTTRALVRAILRNEFRETPMLFIDATLVQTKYRLYHAYRVLEEAHRTFNPKNPPYNKIKQARKGAPEYEDGIVQSIINVHAPGDDQAKVDVFSELNAARRIRKKAEQKRQEELQAEREEEANEERAKAEGTMSECGCCFGDYPLNRMVHCNADILHWFCKDCAKQAAETEIGKSKYILNCMSMDGCEGGFSSDQRSIFMDEKTKIALERNEQEAVLRMAGIENLESCPFCPYAAEYPPVEINKEFRCDAPDCEKVSCRLCKLESHIPKSCEEFAKENGLSIRRQIEEAMSAALIRKCNKCGTPFVKEEGCNKMTCTRAQCGNVQCYVCSQSCQYDHFNDTSRGGKQGNCPLFESVVERHENEVQKAEKEALAKVRAEHPEYTEEDLKIKMSANVLKDDAAQRSKDLRNPLAQAHGFMAAQQAQQQAQHQARLLAQQARQADAAQAQHNLYAGNQPGIRHAVNHQAQVGHAANLQNLRAAALPQQALYPQIGVPGPPENAYFPMANDWQAQNGPPMDMNLFDDLFFNELQEPDWHAALPDPYFGHAPGAPDARPPQPQYEPPDQMFGDFLLGDYPILPQDLAVRAPPQAGYNARPAVNAARPPALPLVHNFMPQGPGIDRVGNSPKQNVPAEAKNQGNAEVRHSKLRERLAMLQSQKSQQKQKAEADKAQEQRLSGLEQRQRVLRTHRQYHNEMADAINAALPKKLQTGVQNNANNMREAFNVRRQVADPNPNARVHRDARFHLSQAVDLNQQIQQRQSEQRARMEQRERPLERPNAHVPAAADPRQLAQALVLQQRRRQYLALLDQGRKKAPDAGADVGDQA